MTTESDTCRKFVDPKPQASGWDKAADSTAGQRCFNDDRIVVPGNQTWRKKIKRTDDLLRYTRNFPIVVTEVKVEIAGMVYHGSVFPQFFVLEAREIFEDLLGKYARDGERQFTLPDVLKYQPILQHGSVVEIAQLFEGFE